ncbi:MAG TPA: tetratricopeptide repeat protein, partial [Myxococcota bacterium]|nr:tetratricopeptide repeat protein [Myxococcota bacterium]
ECLGANKATFQQAQSIVDEVAADDPNAIEPHLARARIYLTQGHLREANAELNYVRAAKPKLLEAQLLAGLLQEAGGYYDEAVRLYLPLVMSPGEFERTDTHHERDAVMALAACYTRLQRYEDALALYQQLATRFPKSAFMLVQLASVQTLLERTADAIATLEKAVQLAPAATDFRTRLAELYRTAGRNQDAIEQCEKVCEAGVQGPAQLFADLRLAELYLEAGTLDKAKIHAAAALAVAAENPDVLTINARVREKLGDQPGAKDAYRKALERNPLTVDAMYRLGLLLARSSDAAEQEEGKRMLERHKRIEPFLQEIRRTQRELEVNSRSPLLLTRLGAYLNLASEFDQARRWLETSDKINSSSPSTCIQLGYVSANLGDDASALKYFERAQRMVGGVGKVEKLDEYVQLLKDGKPLPLPMGEFYRPAQQGQPPPPPAKGDGPPPPAKSGDGASPPAKSGDGAPAGKK